MRTLRMTVGIPVVLAVSAFALFAPFECLGQALKQIGFIDLPGPKGQRFDYLTMDPEDHYLLSAHLGPGFLYVIDVRNNTVVASISGVPGITGIEYVPGLHKAYTSDWGEEKIGVVDLRHEGGEAIGHSREAQRERVCSRLQQGLRFQHQRKGRHRG